MQTPRLILVAFFRASVRTFCRSIFSAGQVSECMLPLDQRRHLPGPEPLTKLRSLTLRPAGSAEHGGAAALTDDNVGINANRSRT
jgi:hypothetical protein